MAKDPSLRAFAHFQSAQAQVAVFRQPIQADMGSHRHEFFEIVFILSGQGWHVTGETRHEVGPGDVLVINNRRAHGYEQTRELSLVNVLLREDVLKEAERELGSLSGYHALFTLEPVRWRQREFRSRLRLKPSDLHTAVGWIDSLEAEAMKDKDGGRFLAKNWLMLLIGLLSRRYGERSGGNADMRLGRLLSQIETNPSEPRALPMMAAAAAMSERSFLRHFREATGFSPADYIIRAKVRRAARMLDDPGLSITEIAYRCGFNDSNYFARQFRRVMGASPRAFRRAA